MTEHETSAAPDAARPAAPPGSTGQIMKDLGPAGVLAAVAAVLPALGGFLLLSTIPQVAEFLRSLGPAGPWIYAGAFALTSGLALLPTYAQSALGGYAFGVAFGLGGALVGFALGALIGYEIARRTSGERIMRLLHKHPRAEAIRDAMVADPGERGFFRTLGLVALLRMPPNSPFALMNVLMASVQVPRVAFMLGTVLGMLPRTAAVVWIGFSFQPTPEGEFPTPRWYWIAGVVATLIVLGVVMFIADRAVRRLTAKPAARR